MIWLKNVLREIFGLFVDDGNFALTILIWLAIAEWVTSIHNFQSVAGIILFAGLALTLLESTIRYARRSSKLR